MMQYQHCRVERLKKELFLSSILKLTNSFDPSQSDPQMLTNSQVSDRHIANIAHKACRSAAHQAQVAQEAL